jgi:hypothetical protein
MAALSCIVTELSQAFLFAPIRGGVAVMAFKPIEDAKNWTGSFQARATIWQHVHICKDNNGVYKRIMSRQESQF